MYSVHAKQQSKIRKKRKVIKYFLHQDYVDIYVYSKPAEVSIFVSTRFVLMICIQTCNCRQHYLSFASRSFQWSGSTRNSFGCMILMKKMRIMPALWLVSYVMSITFPLKLLRYNTYPCGDTVSIRWVVNQRHD